MSVADYLSLVRIPLGVAFVFVAHDTTLALIVLVAAGLSDVLDGWVARRWRAPGRGTTASTGATGSTRCATSCSSARWWPGCTWPGSPPALWLALLLTREVLQLVAVTALRLVPTLHRLSRDYDFRANPLGKATTVVQFVAAAALLVGHPLAGPAVWAAAAMGVLSVFTYVRRLGVPEMGELAGLRRDPAARGALCGLAAAALFGASAPLSKKLLPEPCRRWCWPGCCTWAPGLGLALARLLAGPARARRPRRRSAARTCCPWRPSWSSAAW